MLGKARIREALQLKMSSVTKLRTPQLYISAYCKQTIFEFQHYIWDDHRRNKEEYGLKEVAKKKHDHFMDCLRYIFNFGPRYIPPEEEEDDTEIVYKGKYTKYPTKPSGGSAYYKLVEQREGAGEF
jgi:hypothetical protein